MSGASSLLRRRVLTLLVKHRQREFELLSESPFGSGHGLRHFITTRERFAAAAATLPPSYIKNLNFLGAGTGGYRSFATNGVPDSPTSPSPPDAASGPEAGKIAKVGAVAVTVAAVTWVAYWVLDGKPKEEPNILSKSTHVQPGGTFEGNDKTLRTNQATGGAEKVPHDTGAKTHQEIEVCEIESEPEAIATTEMFKKTYKEAAVTPTPTPKVAGESNNLLQVIQGTPLKPQAMEDVEGKQKMMDSDFQIKEIEDVQSNSQREDKIKNPEVFVAPEELPQIIGESTTTDINGDELTITKLIEVEEDDRQSHLYEIVNRVTVEEIDSNQPAGQPEIAPPLSLDGEQIEISQIEDLEPEPFREQMQGSAKKEDLMEFSDKILYNQTSDDQTEKGVDFATDMMQNSNFCEIEEAPKEISDVLPSYALRDMQGLAESYLLSKARRKEIEEAIGQDSFLNGSENRDQASENYAGAIQESERRQAEADAQFREMLLKLDEEYQQELMEARKQQELQAEYANKLEKDLSAERGRLQAQAEKQVHEVEQRFSDELKRKEEEARRELEKMELLTQARTSAAVTMEKARQLEGTKDLQIQIEALHKAFNARSEGTRVSHTTHKLAMGAFALEDAMLRGAPIEREVELLRQATGGIGNDELIDVALQSLPEGILKEGALTQSQLQDEFESIQGPLRQLALIPRGQGGLLTHAVASAVAAIKVREGVGRDGVESMIATVEKCLVTGQLSEAANLLENGVKGTKAEVFAADWAQKARMRVIAEQALTLVQAHAIATAAGLA